MEVGESARSGGHKEAVVVGIVVALVSVAATVGILGGSRMMAFNKSVEDAIAQIKGTADEQKNELQGIAKELKAAVDRLDENQKQILPNEDYIVDTSRQELAKRVSTELGLVLTPAFDKLADEMGGQKKAFGEVKEELKKRLTDLMTQTRAENAELREALRTNELLLRRSYEEGRAADTNIQQGIDKTLTLQQKDYAEEKMTNEQLRQELRRTRALQEQTYERLRTMSERYLATLKGQNALAQTGGAVKDIVTVGIPRKKFLAEEQKYVEEQLKAIEEERASIDGKELAPSTSGTPQDATP